MDLDDYLNLQSHSDGSTHELQDLLSPTHDNINASAPTGTNASTMDVAKTMASSSTITTATTAATTENEHASLPANYPLFSTTAPTCWNEQMALATNENDTARLLDKPLPDVDQFLYTFGGGNSGIPTASNWNVLEQHQNQHGLSMTPTPLTDLASMPGGLPDFLAPHFLTLTDMENTGDNSNNNNTVMAQQINPVSLPTTNDNPETTGMVTRSKRQKRTTDATTSPPEMVSTTTTQQNDTPVPNADPPPPSKKKRGKKLYCICQQPYDGQPMVQCDGCKQWFHCSCVNLNADEMENVDWMCANCKTDDNGVPEQPTEQAVVQTKNKTSTRQSRHRHTCLLSTCSNHTRANSYCSDVCARLDITTHAHGHSPKPKSKKRTRSIASVDSSDTDSTKNDPGDTATETAITTTPPAKETNKATVDPTRKNVLKPLTTTLTPILTQMADQLPEALEHQVSNDPLEAAESLAILIEGAIFDYLGDQEGGDQGKKHCGSRYKNKVRSLLYNLRDKANREFQLRVVRGDLTPDELAHMSSEDMANPTLKSMSESLREKSIKDSVLKIENMPIIKKTHKGDIIMNPRKEHDKRSSSSNNHDSPSSSSSSSSIPKLSPTTTMANDSNFTQKPATSTKLPANATSTSTSTSSSASSSVNASSVLAPGTSTVAHTPLAMTKDKMDAIWKQIGITRNNDGTPQQHKEQDTSKTKKTSVDLEALLGEEDDDVQLYAGEDDGEGVANGDADQTIVWNGRVEMPEVASFDATARQIGGRLLTKEEWQQVLPSSMYIEGRIRVDPATKYVSSMRQSSSRELVVLEMKCQTSSASNERHMQTLINYFDSLKRYGVVRHDKTKIKDFYLFPLSKSQRVPDALYVVPVDERQRDADAFLGILVISKQQQQYQHHGPLANSNSSVSHSSSIYPQHTPYYPTYHPS